MSVVNKNPGWWLGNAEEHHAASPATFDIPSRALREQCRGGDFVKLLFECEEREDGLRGERMWVEVTGITKQPGGPLYMGALRNSPFVLADRLKHGEKLVFSPEHIADVDMT